MDNVFSSTETEILSVLQDGFPICDRPFYIIGEQVGISEDRALAIVESLISRGIIRRISGFFDPKKLGYTSTLCATQISDEKLRDTVDIINGFECVTHNYLRDNPVYNVWFTVISDSTENLHKHISDISSLAGIKVTEFRGTNFFKIKVRFPLEQSEPDKEKDKHKVVSSKDKSNQLTANDKRIINLLCIGIPVTKQPYLVLAQELGDLSVEDLLTQIRYYKSCGIMRRIGAALAHTKIGYTNNCMVVWTVPTECVDNVGRTMSEEPSVSHCYCRETAQDWPYNLYTMIHGKTVNDIYNTINRFRSSTGIETYQMLFTLEELKKTGMIYF